MERALFGDEGLEFEAEGDEMSEILEADEDEDEDEEEEGDGSSPEAEEKNSDTSSDTEADVDEKNFKSEFELESTLVVSA